MNSLFRDYRYVDVDELELNDEEFHRLDRSHHSDSSVTLVCFSFSAVFDLADDVHLRSQSKH